MCIAEINKRLVFGNTWKASLKMFFAGIGKANSFGEKNNIINLMGLAYI